MMEQVMRGLPSGLVTFLFTDIEGSTKLLRELGEEYGAALTEHRRVLRETFARRGGVEVDTQGDAFFVAFASPTDAVEAAGRAQAALERGPVRVRMGLHTGEPTVTDEGYIGLDVHKGARIAASGHGGQVIISAETRAHLDDTVPLIDLGEHRLKDFDEVEHLFQLGDGRFPPLRTISNTNLPRPTSSFVGRQREVAEILSLLRHGARLVTLSGPGGSGKTRLGIEVASELIPEYRAGVFWVELAAVRDPALVLPTIAQTLGAEADLTSHIGEREMLLLLDNFEQVVEAATDISRLLETCPNLAVLVSSRELLRTRGEVEYAVSPLADSEAVALFCERAQLEPTAEIAELCPRLDNLPLALELAAARTRVLSPAEILDRLSERLDLFRGGRDADKRQATLRETIAWSHGLLSAQEQRLFARLAVFGGGFTLRAAEEICDADLDALQGLVEKSLVRHTGERFWLLETIREYALERVQELGEAEELRTRHYDFFLAVAQSANTSEDAEGPLRMDLVWPEQDNFRSALEMAAAKGEVEPALDLATALELWLVFIPFEGARRLGTLLDSAAGVPDRLRARALRVLGGAQHRSGDVDRAMVTFQESLAIFRALGDESGIAGVLHRLAVSEMALKHWKSAQRYLEDSLTISRRIGVRRLEANNLYSLGDLDCTRGDHEVGMNLLQQSASLAARIGYVWWQGICLFTLAEHGLRSGRFEEVEGWARQGLRLAHELKDQVSIPFGLAQLAWAAAGRGDALRAGRLWGAIEAEEARAPLGGWAMERAEYEAAVMEHAGPEFERGRHEGRQLSLDQAIESALQ
jgi:predicted ATPase/class 3 adenylate cyclase